MSQVVVLNASYEPLGVVTVRRAVVYLLKERAEIVAAVPGAVVRSTTGGEFPVPSVVRFKTMVKSPFLYRELPWTREAMFQRDGFRCAYCLKTCSGGDLTADHLLPKSRGGKLSWLNSVTACKACNNRKANRTPTEARMPLRYQPRVVMQRERLLLAIASTGADLSSLGLA